MVTVAVKKEFIPHTSTTQNAKLKIHIFKELCKGCEICVAFCPKAVLAMGNGQKVAVVNIEACNNCKLCELRCPDLAIFVEKQ